MKSFTLALLASAALAAPAVQKRVDSVPSLLSGTPDTQDELLPRGISVAKPEDALPLLAEHLPLDTLPTVPSNDEKPGVPGGPIVPEVPGPDKISPRSLDDELSGSSKSRTKTLSNLPVKRGGDALGSGSLPLIGSLAKGLPTKRSGIASGILPKTLLGGLLGKRAEAAGGLVPTSLLGNLGSGLLPVGKSGKRSAGAGGLLPPNLLGGLLGGHSDASKRANLGDVISVPKDGPAPHPHKKTGGFGDVVPEAQVETDAGLRQEENSLPITSPQAPAPRTKRASGLLGDALPTNLLDKLPIVPSQESAPRLKRSGGLLGGVLPTNLLDKLPIVPQ